MILSEFCNQFEQTKFIVLGLDQHMPLRTYKQTQEYYDNHAQETGPKYIPLLDIFTVYN